jgi:hypothetical protein
MTIPAWSKTPTRIDTIGTMHTFSRPGSSRTERAFIKRYLMTLPDAYRDTFGNIHVRIGDSPILWSAHTDTVARIGGMQQVTLSAGVLSLTSPRLGNVLGADNTAGVFLLREMVLSGVPGHYVFHRGEESGCVGSHQLAAAFDWSAYTHAIAFDRKGCGDIITHQMGMRTCSEVCAYAIADALNGSHGYLKFRPDDSGLYTDTESYSEQIAECTNVSVGYASAHSSAETLNIDHVFQVLDGLLTFDWSTLPTDRDPRVPDWRHYSRSEYVFTDENDILEKEGKQTRIRLCDDFTRARDYTNDRDDTYLDSTFAAVQAQLRDQINRLHSRKS